MGSMKFEDDTHQRLFNILENSIIGKDNYYFEHMDREDLIELFESIKKAVYSREMS